MSFLLAYQVIQELRINAAILPDIDRPGVDYIDVQQWVDCIDDDGVQAAYQAFNLVQWEDGEYQGLTPEALKVQRVAKAEALAVELQRWATTSPDARLVSFEELENLLMHAQHDTRNGRTSVLYDHTYAALVTLETLHTESRASAHQLGRSCFRLPGGKQPRVSAAPAGTVLPMDTPRGR